MKAILMMNEMPKNCCECYLASSGTSPSDDWCCHGKQVRISTDTGEYTVNKKIELEDIDTIQSWCPLRPLQLPKTKEQVPLVIKNENDSLKEVFEYGVIDGYNECVKEVLSWNACIDELLGERRMIELKFEYFRNMEEVVEALLRNGYKVTIEDLIDKRLKQWKHFFLLTAEKSQPKEITGDTK